MKSKVVRNVLIAAAIGLGILMLACFVIVWAVFHFIINPISERQEAKSQAYEAFQSSLHTASVAYVEGKYGFTPEIIDSVQDRNYQIFGSIPLNMGLVYMQCDGKDFCVYYDLDADCGYDDYQYEEICAVLEDMFRSNGTGYEKMIVDYLGDVRNVEYDPIEDDCEHLFHLCYDGSNLGEVLAYSGFAIAGCYTAGEDFSQKTNWQVPQELLQSEDKRCTLSFLSFRSAIPEVLYSASYKLGYFLMMPETATYVHSYYSLSNTEETVQRRFDLIPCGEIRLMAKEGDAAFTAAVAENTEIQWVTDAAEGEAVGSTYRVESESQETIYVYVDGKTAARYSEKGDLWLYVCKEGQKTAECVRSYQRTVGEDTVFYFSLNSREPVLIRLVCEQN